MGNAVRELFGESTGDKLAASLRDAEDLLHERGIAINHETVRFW